MYERSAKVRKFCIYGFAAAGAAAGTNSCTLAEAVIQIPGPATGRKGSVQASQAC